MGRRLGREYSTRTALARPIGPVGSPRRYAILRRRLAPEHRRLAMLGAEPETGRPGDLTLLEVRVGDIAQLRKRHPCGSDEWRVVRIGADIGLRCLGCDRRVTLPRHRFERRVKTLRHAAGDADPGTGSAEE